MARKRSHRNTPRLTAKERAISIVSEYTAQEFHRAKEEPLAPRHFRLADRIQRAIQAAVRQALARKEWRTK